MQFLHGIELVNDELQTKSELPDNQKIFSIIFQKDLRFCEAVKFLFHIVPASNCLRFKNQFIFK